MSNRSRVHEQQVSDVDIPATLTTVPGTANPAPSDDPGRFVASLFDECRDVVVFADSERRILSVNPAVEEVFGYGRDELAGQSTRVLYADAESYENQGAMRYNPSSAISSSNYTIRYRRKDGEVFPAETTGVVVRGNAGEVSGYIGIIRDISERHHVQTTLNRIYRITADQGMTGSQKVQELLELGCRYFGLSLGIVSRIEGERYEVVYAAAPNGEVAPGMTFEVSDTYCLHTLVADAPQAFHHAAESEIASHPCYRQFGLESYIGVPLMVDGERFGTLNFSDANPRAPFSETDQEFVLLFSQWIGNKLAQQRAVDRLEEARSRAEQANDAKSRFLATVSHELRTPLSGILGMLDLLGMTFAGEEQKSYIRQARVSSEALLVLLNDILDLSKVEAGGLELEKRPFDVVGLVESVVSTFQPSVTEKGVALSARIADGLPAFVLGDEFRVRQIVTNLLSNAVRFTESGRIDVSLDRSCTTDAMILSVIDTGIGIPVERVDGIFDKFVQADASTTRKYGGTGLGLAICRSLTEMMGGSISVHSEEGKGTRFTVVLPLAVAPQPSATASGEAALSPPATPAVRLLVAEDVDVNAFMLKKMLEKHGHTVDVVSNGLEAVEAVEAGSYDGVILDMHMPVMDGTEAARRIRALPPPKNAIPLIALTADAVSENRHRYLGAGLNEFLTKPINWQSLDEAIARHVVPHRDAPGRAPKGASVSHADTVEEPGREAAGRVDAARVEEVVETLGQEAALRLLYSFEATVSDLSMEMEEAARAGDREELSRQLHRLSGLAMTFGANTLVAAIRNCDPAVTGKAPERSAIMLVDAEFRMALKEIRGLTDEL